MIYGDIYGMLHKKKLNIITTKLDIFISMDEMGKDMVGLPENEDTVRPDESRSKEKSIVGISNDPRFRRGRRNYHVDPNGPDKCLDTKFWTVEFQELN